MNGFCLLVELLRIGSVINGATLSSLAQYPAATTEQHFSQLIRKTKFPFVYYYIYGNLR